MNTVEFQIYSRVSQSYVTIDIDQRVTFPFTIKVSDITLPASVGFDLSKQIDIPRTKHNNNFFSEIWKIDQLSHNFVSNIRTDFRLYVAGDLFTSGYVQLEEVEDTYKIRLYGGLGDYLFHLKEKPLKELSFGSRFNHVINASQVLSSFNNHLENTAGEDIGDIFGYALTYQGNYDDFDNKSVIKSESLSGPGYLDDVTWESDKKKYTDVDLNEHTRTLNNSRWQIRGEYRSYYQKPMIKVSAVLEQIFKDVEGEGWTTVLDKSFFHEDNPYWEDLWCILPQYDISSGEGGQDVLRSYGNMGELTGDNLKPTTIEIPLTYTPSMIQQGSSAVVEVELPFKFFANFIRTSGDFNRHQNKDQDLIVTGQILVNGGANYGGITRNLSYVEGTGTNIILNGTTVEGEKPRNAAAASYYYRRTGEEESLYTLKGSVAIPPEQTNQDVTVEVRLQVSGNTNWRESKHGKTIRYYGFRLELQDEASVNIGSSGAGGIRSGATVTFDDIIRSDVSQFDFLNSYCKAFGMYLVKDKYKKEVTIMTRNTFFGAQERIDWTEKVDHKRGRSINPVPFDFRRGIFKWKSLETKHESEYLSKYGREYGSFRFDTGNGFIYEDKDVLEGNIFDNCIIATDVNKYYLDRVTNGTFIDNKTLPYLQDNSGSRVDNSFTLVFRDGLEEANYRFLVTDDDPLMYNYGYCWNENQYSTYPPNSYPKLRRTIQRGDQTYSLYFGVPYKAYNDEEANILTAGATIYDKFWDSYISDRYSYENKKLTLYVCLSLSDVQSYLLNKFIYLENTIWVINRITDFNPLSAASTKVELLKVQNINNYTGQSYISGNLIIRNSSGSPIYDSSGAQASAASPVQLRVPSTATSASFQIESTVEWQIGAISDNLTISPLSGDAGTTTVNASFPANTTGENQIYNIPIIWGGVTTTLQIVIVGNWTVSTSTNAGSTSVNGGGATAQIPDGDTVTLSTTAPSNYGFGYWTVNGAYFYEETINIVVTENINAVAYWYDKSQYVKMTTDDTNTTIPGVTKYDNSFWLLRIGQTYTFNNDQANLSGFLFGSDSEFTQEKQRTIKATDTTLQVFYDSILINITAKNESPTQDFSGDLISIGDTNLSFELEPGEEKKIGLALTEGGEITNERYPYHYVIYEGDTEFEEFGVYNLRIIGYRVGWEGDDTVILEEGGAETFEREVYGPIEFTLTTEGDVTVSPESAESDTEVSISVGMEGGTKYIRQHIGEFIYTLTITQPEIKPIGWLGDGTVVLNVNVDKDVTEYEAPFYNNELEIELSEGLEAGEQQTEEDGSTYFNITATFEPNKEIYPVTKTFTVICNGRTFTLNIIQGASDLPEGNYWGQSPDENGTVTGGLTGADGLTPSETCSFDIGTQEMKYKDAWFCGDVNCDTVNGNLNGNASTANTAETANKVNGTLTFTGGVTASYNGSSDLSINIPEIKSIYPYAFAGYWYGSSGYSFATSPAVSSYSVTNGPGSGGDQNPDNWYVQIVINWASGLTAAQSTLCAYGVQVTPYLLASDGAVSDENYRACSYKVIGYSNTQMTIRIYSYDTNNGANLRQQPLSIFIPNFPLTREP